MFAKLKYHPLSRTPWSVSIHTPRGWKTLNVLYSHLEIPLETVLYLNALSARPPSPAPASASNACCPPTKDGEPCQKLL